MTRKKEKEKNRKKEKGIYHDFVRLISNIKTIFSHEMMPGNVYSTDRHLKNLILYSRHHFRIFLTRRRPRNDISTDANMDL